MRSDRETWARSVAAALFAVALVAGAIGFIPSPAAAFHFPWDQGHDTFDPDPGDDDNDPGDDPPCNSGSPFDAQTGNFVHPSFDVAIGSQYGPSLVLARVFNSRDARVGPFGHGWSFSFDQRLAETTDGASVNVIAHQGSGARHRFLRLPSGQYLSPPHVQATLIATADGGAVLREKNGFTRRFDPSGRLDQMADRTGNTLTITYDETGFPTRISDRSGRTILLTKGADGHVANVTDPAGRVYQYDYDQEGNLVGFTDPLGSITAYAYDAKHNLTRVADSLGHVRTKVEYDSEGRVASYTTREDRWTVSYDPSQRRTTKRDSKGNAWVLHYDERGIVHRIVNPLGGEGLFQFDDAGHPVSVSDENGHATQVSYDERGNALAITNADGKSATYEYEPIFNQVSRITDPLGNATTLSYDAVGNLTELLDAAGNRNKFDYDDHGGLVGLTDPLGNVTSFEYDDIGNVVATIDPLGNREEAAFDAAGNVVARTDGEGAVRRYEYDARDRLTGIIDPLGATTAFEYDGVGNLLRIVDAGGASTSYEYDDFNRLIGIVDEVGRRTGVAYDSKNRVSQVTDRNGRGSSFTYDALGRLVSRTTQGGAATFAYDPRGNLKSAIDSDSSVAFDYDVLDRIVRVVATDGQLPPATIGYTYDQLSRRVGMLDPSGDGTTYSYDALSHLERVLDATGREIIFEYDKRGRRAKRMLSSGVETVYGYDAAGSLTSLVTSQGASTIQDIRLEYDRNGRRVRKLVGARDWLFQYDGAGQLVNVLDQPSALPLESYSYDAVGNRDGSHLSTSYLYDATHALASSDTHTYTYDAEGNLATRKAVVDGSQTSYAYDGEDQLVRVDLPDGQSVDYRYDALGRRIGKSGLVSRSYVYDGEDVLVERDAAGTPIARYVQGPGVDEPILASINGEAVSYVADDLGSIVSVLGDDGSPLAEHTYDAFGRVLSRTGPLSQSWAFTGREYDSETGLYYVRARYYDAEVGRFTQRDPVLFPGRSPYVYVENDPANLVDPTGQCPFCIAAWAAFEVGLAIYDAYTTADTLTDPCASGAEKLVSFGGFLIGALAPGGGYGSIGKQGVRRVLSEEADDAARFGAQHADDFFEGTKYTDKVLGQIKQGDYHGFPESVTGFQSAGEVTKITGGDGVVRDMLRIPGSYKGKEGYFEFIKEADGSINHRKFEPNR